MNILNHMPFFISGILAYLLMPEMNKIRQRLGNNTNLVSLLVLGGVSVYLLHYFYSDNNNINLYITYSLAWLILISISVVGFPHFLNNVFTRFLGKASYSIYLNHSIVILFLKLSGFFGFISAEFKSGEASFCVAMLSVSVLTLIMSYFTYHYIEIPGMALGKKILTYKSVRLKQPT
ncbi:hypothetical protein [Phytobacter sp. RSE-02]|uniref:acyltransferase family protein n=1 Tax=Phytobacter sp. RSE-02 TaxID=3229229 RepID=UPI00339D4F15